MTSRVKKFILPVVMLGLLFYATSHSSEIINNYKVLFGFGSNDTTPEQQILTALVSSEKTLYESSNVENMFDSSVIIDKFSSLLGCTYVGHKEMSLVGGVWAITSQKPQALEITLKAEKLSDGLSAIDSLGFYYEEVRVSSIDNMLTVLVRLEGVS